ncbi:movement protein [Parsley severe stunt associated virus]|uniref:Movement protein n=1 Tax=Parsley severe stunt associated virus TaxID=2558055 RepID=A0A482G1M9_9VIRU|nr:movement protein [Parsley severe stunt associated virus]QBO55985.1 movement protein [Parsley severe stunt associated virus]
MEYEGHSYEQHTNTGKPKEVLYVIAYVVLVCICLCILWICINVACLIPRYFRTTMEGWLMSNSIVKKKIASRITGTPLDETGTERNRNWDRRRSEEVSNKNNTEERARTSGF